MGKRSRLMRSKSKSDFDDENPNNSSTVVSDSDDDVAANEDLSLKIVQKAISRAASRAVASGDVEEVGGVVTPVVMKKVKKKRKVNKADTLSREVTLTKEEVTVGATNDVEPVIVPETTETDGVDNSNVDNAILRKLLRGPRYFDPPEKSWGACFNCGEEGHNAVNCKSAKRKRPCFICGSLEHEVKQCQKAQDCYICKGTGHRAKDCPKKSKRCYQGSELCLKCGAAGHAMFSCNNDYSPVDMKEIQCYVCKKFGHLCCADYSDAFSSQVSCYKCGQSGHNGQECRGSRGTGETSTGSPSSCFKCGKDGHFARECRESVKAKKRTCDFSTPTGKRPKDHKGKKGAKSAPQEVGKGRKKKKLLFDDQSPNWSGKSKWRGGWIADDPDYPPHKNAWRSPATPKMKHKIYSLADPGRDSSSRSSNRSKFSHGTSSSRRYAGSYQHSPKSHQHSHRYSASRFGYANNSDGMRRNHDWW